MNRRSGPGLRAAAGMVLAASIVPAFAIGDDLHARLEAAVAAALPGAIETRHHLHRHPELSNREVETSALVAAVLEELGYEVTAGVAHTGVVGLLRGGRPGPVVALRADMDALPVTEQTDLPFRSTRRTTYLGQEVGVAHACGHDIHTSVLLGVANALAGIGDALPGTVKLLFQPAEEGPPPGEEGGAPMMIAEGVLDGPRPQAIFALHAFPDTEVGHVGLNAGPTMAAVDRFRARVIGRQSHGAAPHLGIDPIVMAAQAVTALQTIRSRTLPPLEPSVVTVGVLHGGERYNIIPGEVRLEGTVRTYREEVRARVQERMHAILDGITRAGGGRYELEYQSMTPATVNDPALTDWSRAVLERALGADRVHTVQPVMGGEDFAFYAEEIPGFYFRLGVVAPGTTSGGLHTPDFRADDGAIEVGMRALGRLAVEFLVNPPSTRPGP